MATSLFCDVFSLPPCKRLHRTCLLSILPTTQPDASVWREVGENLRTLTRGCHCQLAGLFCPLVAMRLTCLDGAQDPERQRTHDPEHVTTLSAFPPRF